MRIKTSRGRNAKKLCEYLLREEKQDAKHKRPNPIFDSNMVGAEPAVLAAEFALWACLNPRVERSVVHYSVSFPPGENPDEKIKKLIIQELLCKAGHGQSSPYFAVEHFDGGTSHFHIATTSIRSDGSWVSDSKDRWRLREIEREIEEKLKLRSCPHKNKAAQFNLTTGEHRLESRTGAACPRRIIYQALQEATNNKTTMSGLIEEIASKGIGIGFHEFPDGKQGLSFGIDGDYFQGRQIAPRFSFQGLQTYSGISYIPENDNIVLRKISSKSFQPSRNRGKSVTSRVFLTNQESRNERTENNSGSANQTESRADSRRVVQAGSPNQSNELANSLESSPSSIPIDGLQTSGITARIVQTTTKLAEALVSYLQKIGWNKSDQNLALRNRIEAVNARIYSLSNRANSLSNPASVKKPEQNASLEKQINQIAEKLDKLTSQINQYLGDQQTATTAKTSPLNLKGENSIGQKLGEIEGYLGRLEQRMTALEKQFSKPMAVQETTANTTTANTTKTTPSQNTQNPGDKRQALPKRQKQPTL